MKKRLLLGLIALISFGIAVNIYTDLRGYHGGLFDFGNSIFPIDLSQMIVALSADSFVLYNLPDGLWMLSLFLTLMMIWNDWTHLYIWLAFGLTMAISLEAFQYFKFISGTFDIRDIITYLIAFFFALIIHKTINFDKWKTGKHTYFRSLPFRLF